MANDLDEEAKVAAQAIFDGKVQGRSACYFCSGIHGVVAKLPAQEQPCPRIKRLVRGPGGTVQEVEFWPAGAWETNVVFPWDLSDE